MIGSRSLSLGMGRAAPILAALLLLAGAAAAGENRAWFLELRLIGPLEEVHFDCGEEGATRLIASLREGEEVRLAVPLPLRSPLGAAPLEQREIPTPRITGAGAVQVLGWSERQPSAAIDRLPPGLRARARPALPDSRPRAGGAALALVAAAFLLALTLRRPRALAPAAALVAAAGALLLTVSAPSSRETVRVLEGDLASGTWLEAWGARDRLEGLGDRLEVVPDGRSLLLEGELLPGVGARDPRFVAHAVAAELHARRVVSHSDGLAAPPAGVGSPAACWVRDAAGTRHGGGGWKWGETLSIAPGGGEKGAPPGWLEAGMPPGIEVLLGRFGGEDASRWLRVTGPIPETFAPLRKRD